MNKDTKDTYDSQVAQATRELDDTILTLARDHAQKLGQAIRKRDEKVAQARRSYRQGNQPGKAPKGGT